MSLRNGRFKLDETSRQDFDLVITAALTLLALIVGFTFSMAIARYDTRKTYEEAEANAIGTEYVRADLLPDTDATRVRAVLKEYLDQRVLFYTTRDSQELGRISVKTSRLRTQLWSAVQKPTVAQSTPVLALALSGMNDVLNSQGYTQAAFWNRIPIAAWTLMVVMAICSNLLVGYGRGSAGTGGIQFLVLPLVLSIAFFLVGDIDSPRRGIIRVRPQNLIALVQSLQTE